MFVVKMAHLLSYFSGAPCIAQGCIFPVPQGSSLSNFLLCLETLSSWEEELNLGCDLKDESVEGGSLGVSAHSKEREPYWTDNPQCSDPGQLGM